MKAIKLTDYPVGSKTKWKITLEVTFKCAILVIHPVKAGGGDSQRTLKLQ